MVRRRILAHWPLIVILATVASSGYAVHGEIQSVRDRVKREITAERHAEMVGLRAEISSLREDVRAVRMLLEQYLLRRAK